MTRPLESLNPFIAHQPTDLRDRFDRESVCTVQMEDSLGRDAAVLALHYNVHCLTVSSQRGRRNSA